MSLIIVIALNLLCMGHATAHSVEPAESTSCNSGQQCDSDNVGLLQHKVQTSTDIEDEDENEDSEEDSEKDEDEEDHNWTPSGNTVQLTNADFARGTLRIQQGGKYQLAEDIKFDPKKHGNDPYPQFGDPHYDHTLGYFLGFFAAIAVEADYVEIDCNNKKIEMSHAFHKHQRFFALIELGSKPFITGAGPPPFSRPQMMPKPFVAPSYVKIRRCNFGLTSHYGVHGNDAKYVQIREVACTNFEVACVSVNNCANCRIHKVKAITNLQHTFPSELGQSILLNNMVNEVAKKDANGLLADYFKKVEVPLRGESPRKTAHDYFRKLKKDLKQFLYKDSGDLQSLLGNKGLPDGSAAYGIVMNMRGPAAGVFGAEKGKLKDLKQQGVLVKRASVQDIEVKNLRLKPQAWISFRDPTDTNNKRKLQDPAGAVFRAAKWRVDPGNDDTYKGNTLSDAQIAIAHVVLQAADDHAKGLPGAAEVWLLVNQYYGGTTLATNWGRPALTWANHEITWDVFKAGYNVECNGDSMDHVNKGIVAVRLEYLDRPKVKNLDVADLTNEGGGPEDPFLCPAEVVNGKDVIPGNDVKGLIYVNTAGVNKLWQKVPPVMNIDLSSLTGGYGGKVTDRVKLRTRPDVDEDLED